MLAKKYHMTGQAIRTIVNETNSFSLYLLCSQNPFSMNEHDPRCTGSDDQRLLDNIAEYGWHVIMVLDQDDSPGWAYSIGLHHSFNHPEIIVFGLELDLMQSIIDNVGEAVRSGNKFEIGKTYPDLIEDYSCTFNTVKPVWYDEFLCFATWYYKESDFPALQCFWPDFDARFPWEPHFNKDLLSAQPLLFHDEPTAARASDIVKALDLEIPG
jgi:hypothetical protein